MTVRTTTAENKTALYCSVSGEAFGPVFDSEAEADEFLTFVLEVDGRDARQIPVKDLLNLKWQFDKERESAA